MKYTIVAVGKMRPPYVDDAEHYAKLLRGHARVEVVELKEDADVARRLPDRAHVVLLDVGGRTYDSPAFARWLEDRRQAGRDVCFVIGGAFGLELPGAQERLSFGPMTFPHQLARVLLFEQLFRAHKILAGEPYHL
jgi:23S rRNA (pseudouridine1915-N3)-methyltransferase